MAKQLSKKKIETLVYGVCQSASVGHVIPLMGLSTIFNAGVAAFDPAVDLPTNIAAINVAVQAAIAKVAIS